MPDYSDFQVSPGANLKATLTSYVDELQEYEREIEELNEKLEVAKTNQRRLSEQQIPDLLDGLGGSLNLDDGRVVTVTEKIRAHISKENQREAYQWLSDNDHGSIIKNKFTIEFSKNQEDQLKIFEEHLSKVGIVLNVKKDQSIQWQTLDAAVREMMENGEDFPKSAFGVHKQKNTKIKNS